MAWLDKLQTGLDVAGMTPIVGNFVDLINAGISFQRGDVASGVLRASAALPGIGQAVTLGKLGKTAATGAAKGTTKGTGKLAGEGVDTAVRNQKGSFGKMGEGAFGRAGASTRPPRQRGPRSRQTSGRGRTDNQLLGARRDTPIDRVASSAPKAAPTRLNRFTEMLRSGSRTRPRTRIGATLLQGGEPLPKVSEDASALGIPSADPLDLKAFRTQQMAGLVEPEAPEEMSQARKDYMEKILEDARTRAFEDSQAETLSNVDRRRELGNQIISRMTREGAADPMYFSKNPEEKARILREGRKLGDSSFDERDFDRVVRNTKGRAKQQQIKDYKAEVFKKGDAEQSRKGLDFTQSKILERKIAMGENLGPQDIALFRDIMNRKSPAQGESPKQGKPAEKKLPDDKLAAFDATKNATIEQKPLSAADELKAIEAEKAEFDMLQAEEQERYEKDQEEYQKKLAEVDEKVKEEEERRAEEAKKREEAEDAELDRLFQKEAAERKKKRSVTTAIKEEALDPVGEGLSDLKDFLIGGGRRR